MPIRADSGGGTPEFLTWLTRPSRRLQYSAGMVITAESIAIRILVPDTHRPWAFPCRADDQADEPAFRQRADQTSRRYTNAISESGTRSAAPTIDPASAPRGSTPTRKRTGLDARGMTAAIGGLRFALGEVAPEEGAEVAVVVDDFGSVGRPRAFAVGDALVDVEVGLDARIANLAV